MIQASMGQSLPTNFDTISSFCKDHVSYGLKQRSLHIFLLGIHFSTIIK